MGKIICPNPVKLIFSIISAEDKLFYESKCLLMEHFGNIDMESDYQPFDYTSYYRNEMGDNLKQILISFEELFLPDQITQIKLKSNKWEYLFCENEYNSNQPIEKQRRVNFDPGYIALDKFILASTKNGPARIYICQGIYAEITLRFVNGTFCPIDWTYPNYKTESYICFLNKVRDKYKKQIKTLKK